MSEEVDFFKNDSDDFFARLGSELDEEREKPKQETHTGGMQYYLDAATGEMRLGMKLF